MPKAKRPRTEPELTHEEIWDDSSLLSSWNDALKEYKKYHSLHARGIQVSEALERHDAAEQAGSEDPIKAVFEQDEANQGMTNEDEDVRYLEDQVHEGIYAESEDRQPEQEAKDEFGRNADAHAEAAMAETQLGSVPAALFNGAGPAADNPALKNLMMSWYYAGYYTGLHEGEQRALAQFQRGAGDDSGNR